MSFLFRICPMLWRHCEAGVLLFMVIIWSPKAQAGWFGLNEASSARFASVALVSSRPLPVLNYNGRYAHVPPDMPGPVQTVVKAANRLQGKPYVWGGGHRYLYDHGYDCSGSVSYVLHQAGLLPGPRTAQDFRNYGAPGPGRFITIYASGGHVFMSVCGLRFDTSDFGSGRGDGPRWRPTARNQRGYVLRHPPGL